MLARFRQATSNTTPDIPKSSGASRLILLPLLGLVLREKRESVVDRERLILLLDRIGLLEIRRQRLQGRSRRGRGHPRLQSADDHELSAPAIIELALVLGLEIVRDLIVNPERQTKSPARKSGSCR